MGIRSKIKEAFKKVYSDSYSDKALSLLEGDEATPEEAFEVVIKKAKKREEIPGHSANGVLEVLGENALDRKKRRGFFWKR